MLKSIILQNFKGFERMEIPLKDGVTLLVGPNNSGKSSILQGILLGLECLRLLVEGDRLGYVKRIAFPRGVLAHDPKRHKG